MTVWPVHAPPFLIECKAPGGVLSDLQREMHARLRAGGHVVLLADGIESLRLGLAQAGLCTIEAAGQPMRQPKVRGL